MKLAPFFLISWAVILGVVGCGESRQGLSPVLGDDATPAQRERFARRLHLDLTGLPPSPEAQDAIVLRLGEEGNTAETRGAIAADVLASPAARSLLVTEVTEAAYSGQSLDAGYDLVCQIAISMDPECGACDYEDSCSCGCPQIQGFAAERKAFDALVTDLAEGGDTRTSEIEEALCASSPFLFNNTSAEGIAAQVFQVFLTRPPEPEELRNARFMIFGTFAPPAPSGLLFHRHGGSYEDLLDIVFESEVYREAVVTRVFSRFLGRRPDSDELRFLSASLDAERPDMRDMIHAVVSSSEYFHQ